MYHREVQESKAEVGCPRKEEIRDYAGRQTLEMVGLPPGRRQRNPCSTILCHTVYYFHIPFPYLKLYGNILFVPPLHG